MTNYSISFDYPWVLVLLIIIPLVWVLSFNALAGLGNGRRLAALFLRSIVLTLIILAISGIQWVRISNKVTVIYLLDQSDSIAREKRELMLDYAIKSVKAHRDGSREDGAGLIVFGREAAIEFPPNNDNLPVVRAVESYLGRTDATNLESALKLAQASFPEGTSKRVVVITDGVETIGQAKIVAQAMADNGIGIDVVPIDLLAKSEVLVEKVDIPNNLRQGQPFETRVVVNRYQAEGNEPVQGRLRLLRSVGTSETTIVDDEVTLDKSVNVFPITDTISQPGGYTYRAEFVTENKSDDALQQNNRADSFTYVKGKGRVLLIEDWSLPGEHANLVEALRKAEIEVDVMPNNQLFTSLAQLQIYDSIILANVPRNSGGSGESIAGESISGFSDEQIEMLATNTEQFGCGLIMIGGPESMGAGGWSNTAVEKALPVDFQVKNTKIEAVGALAMVMHACEIAQGNYWQKKIGEAALDVLGPSDFCGVLEFSGMGDKWLWGDKNGMLRVGPNKTAMLQRIRNMAMGDMPDFQSSMQMALASLVAVPASLKHMIIISDGDPAAPTGAILNQFAKAQIKISTVAVGTHGPAGSQTLQKIASSTGGNYYVASSATALPRIFQREAMRVARPLVREPEGGFTPVITYPHEILTGLPRQLPRTAGYVLSTVKSSGLVEVAIRSNDSEMEIDNQTVLASWSYGLGRTAVFSSDTGRRWTKDWSDIYDQFWSQFVRWTMRPSDTDAKFSVATNITEGRVQVVVNALSRDDEFLNFLEMQAVAVGPTLDPYPIVMRQVAPGRYVGTFDADRAGSYLVNVVPGPGIPPLVTGASIPYSDEYRIRKTNYTNLEQLSKLVPKGGEAGLVTANLEASNFKDLLANDSFRGGLPRAYSMQDIWPLCVLLGSLCLFGDIFIRRVALDYAYPIKWMASKISGKQMTQQDMERQASLQRLRTRKSEVSEQVETARSSTRFEADTEVDLATLQDALPGRTNPAKSEPKTAVPGLSSKDDQDGYTSRLLAAKKAAQKKSDNG
jgi:uncharacterized membrane protein